MCCCDICEKVKSLYAEQGGVPLTAELLVYDPAKGCARVSLGDLFEKETVYVEKMFARSANGLVQSSSRESTITRTAQGQWNVVFAAAHPDGAAYHPSLTPEEQSANRDSVDIQVVQGSQTANGFKVMLTTGDNGGGEDTYVDSPWSMAVTCPIEVVTGIKVPTP